MSESALPGGRLGGLFEFRQKTLDTTQNALGRMALALGATVNAQHQAEELRHRVDLELLEDGLQVVVDGVAAELTRRG